MTAFGPLDAPTAEAGVIAAARAFAGEFRGVYPDERQSLLGRLIGALDDLDEELARDEPTQLRPATRALIEDSERLRREHVALREQASTLSRLLRGMARRAWQMRRTVETTNQLYARELHRRERAEQAVADARAETDLVRAHCDQRITALQQETARHAAALERQLQQARGQAGERAGR